jgi:hypothetical protein
MAVKLVKSAAAVNGPTIVKAPAGKPAAARAGKPAAPRAVETVSRVRAEPVSADCAPAVSDIFAALEKARANMREGDANLARARKILG